MRIAKILIALVAIVAAGLLVAIHFYRDTVALEIANRALRGQDVVVTDVSVDAIGAEAVSFSKIDVETADGARIRVEGVTLPVGILGLRGERFVIDRLRIDPGSAGDEAPAVAAILETVLAIPQQVTGVFVDAAELSVAGYPTIVDVSWSLAASSQAIRATIDRFTVTLTIGYLGDDHYRSGVHVVENGELVVANLAADIRRKPDSGFSIDGDATVLMQPLLPTLMSVGLVPGEVDSLAVTLKGPFAVDVAAEAEEGLTLSARLSVEDESSLRIESDADSVIDIEVTKSTPVVATLEYPSLDWKSGIDELRLRVAAEGGPVLPLKVSRLDCRSGIRCTLDVSATLGPRVVDDWQIGAVGVGLQGADLTADDGGWRVSSADLRIDVDRLGYRSRSIDVPIIRGRLEADGDGSTAELTLQAPGGGIDGAIGIRHEFATASGSMTIRRLTMDFAQQAAADRLSPWDYEWNVSAGTWAIEGRVEWESGGSGIAYRAGLRNTLEDIAGNYGDIAFAGLETDFDLDVESEADAVVSPLPVRLDLVDIGLPLTDLRAQVAVDVGGQTVDVDGLTLSLLGGRLAADRFSFDPAASSNSLLLKPLSIQLPLMVALTEFDNIETRGSVSGEIPVTVQDGIITISSGRLENDPPGGVIRYASAAAGTSDSQLGVVINTLRNFEFDVLTSKVDYSRDGDLVLEMRLEGRNPDVDANQPVILNLNVENNVPQLLRSLQATRSIEDILERKAGK